MKLENNKRIKRMIYTGSFKYQYTHFFSLHNNTSMENNQEKGKKGIKKNYKRINKMKKIYKPVLSNTNTHFFF